MARLERLKYLPMLYRAYQEARDRTQSGQRETLINSLGTDDGNAELNRHSRATTELREGEPQTQKRVGNNRTINPGSRRRTRTWVGTKTSLGQASRRKGKNPPLRRGTAPKHRQGRLQPQVRRSPQAALQHVLNELRATKQQLSQLQAIQTQLNKVQVQLDQQLEVIRGSLKEETNQEEANRTPEKEKRKATSQGPTDVTPRAREVRFQPYPPAGGNERTT